MSSVFCCGTPATTRWRGHGSLLADGRASARTGLMGIPKHGTYGARGLRTNDQAYSETDLALAGRERAGAINAARLINRFFSDRSRLAKPSAMIC